MDKNSDKATALTAKGIKRIINNLASEARRDRSKSAKGSAKGKFAFTWYSKHRLLTILNFVFFFFFLKGNLLQVQFLMQPHPLRISKKSPMNCR